MITHAICCWCQQPLVLIHTAWWCPTASCRSRQRSHAMGRTVGTQWEWLYVPTPKQVEFDACPARYVLYGGAAGPGKSYGARWALYRKATRIKNFEALLLRKTFPELFKTHLRAMAREAEVLGAKFTKTEKILEFPQTGAIIECGHMDDAAAVQKYLSTEYDVIVPDEGSTFDPNSLLELSTRARSSKPQVQAEGGAKFWVVSNPGGPSSSVLLDFFIDQTPDLDQYPVMASEYDASQWAYIPATLDDNPYLDPHYLTSLSVLSKWRYEQLRHGDWRVFSGQFFSEWRESHHVETLEPARDGRWFLSLDWGRNQPGCVLWWAILPDRRLFIRQELKFKEMSEQDVAAKIRAMNIQLGLTRTQYCASDPSIFNKTGSTHTDGTFLGQSIGESLNHYGVGCLRADHDRLNGWGRCHALLRDREDGTPWLTVHPDCRYLIRSIAAATSDPTDPDDVDTKSDDHALDSFRYGAMSRPVPAVTKAAPVVYPFGTMGYERQQADRQRVRVYA